MMPAVAEIEQTEQRAAPDVQVLPVRSAVVPDVWPRVEAMVRAAIAEGPGDENVADVLELLARRDYQLWVVLRDGEVAAAVVTTIANKPRRKLCRIVYLGGEGADQWIVAVRDTLAAWARQLGCDALEFWGRPGWAKLVKQIAAGKVMHVYREAI